MNPVGITGKVTPTEIGKTQEKAPAKVEKQDLAKLSEDGLGKSKTSPKGDANPANGLLAADSKASSSSKKTSFFRMFDKSVPSSDKTAKAPAADKLKHQKDIDKFFKKNSPEEFTFMDAPVNEPEYIKKTLDTLFGIIDESKKYKEGSPERAACTAKFQAFISTPDFANKLGFDTSKQIFAALHDYKDKK